VKKLLVSHEETFNQSTPFFLYMAYQQAHTPMQAKDEFLSIAKEKYFAACRTLRMSSCNVSKDRLIHLGRYTPENILYEL
jgi:hypothetical protein